MATTQNSQGTFVLVHGAWSGGWCYHKVAARLRAKGHLVFTPTLTRQGERAHLVVGNVNLSLHIEDILAVLHYEDLSNVVLAGHSYGGMVITGVADRAADRIAALAYLDAFLPDDGQSLFDINIPENTQRLLASAASADGLSVPAPPAVFFNVNANDAARVDALATPHPIGAFTEKIRLTGAHKTIARRAYVHGTVLPRESPFKPFYDRVKADPAWQAHALACGHHVMLDEPDRVTEILQSLI